MDSYVLYFIKSNNDGRELKIYQNMITHNFLIYFDGYYVDLPIDIAKEMSEFILGDINA